MNRWLGAGAILAGSIALGAIREFLFLNLNYQIDHVERGTPYSYAHSLFQGWTKDLDLEALVLLKWSLSLAFIATLAAAAVGTARLLYPEKRYGVPILIGTVTMAFLAFGLHLGGSWLPPLGSVGVKVLHALQYPVVLLLLWVARPLVDRADRSQ